MKPGRTRIEFNLKEVEDAAAEGLNESEVGARLGVSLDTIQRRKKDNAEFAAAMKTGRARAHAAVSSRLMSLIKKGNLGAIVWYEKTRKGYSDRVQQEMTGRDGEAIKITSNVFSHTAAVASIASRSNAHHHESGANESGGDGAPVG